MRRVFILLSTIFISMPLFAQEPISAHRDLETDWQAYHNAIKVPGSPEALAIEYGSGTLNRAPEWPSIASLHSAFEKIRDERFLTDATRADFPRRITWLYPDDGCYARAGLFVQQAKALGLPLPGKVFAFGNLSVRTANISGGVVGWWFHVAPVVQVAGAAWVLDPAIEPDHPLKLDDWVARLNRNPSRVKVAVCASGTYDPIDSCRHESDGLEERAQRDDGHFLHLEWSRLLQLKRNPERELGDQPPWAR